MPVSIADLDASYLVVSSHKIGGPPGAGALILAPGAPFTIGRFGGGQERGRRPGTENVGAIVGFGVAVGMGRCATWSEDIARMRTLRDRFEAGLPRDAVIFGAKAAAPAEHLEFRAAGHRRRNCGHRHGSRRRCGVVGRRVLVGQGALKPRACGDGRCA